MFATRRRIAAALLAGCALGVGIPTYRVSAAERKEETKPVKGAEDLPALLKARLEVAQKEYEARKAEFEAGRGTFDGMKDSAHRLLTAQVEASDKKADQIAAYQAHLGRMREAEAYVNRLFGDGRAAAGLWYQACYHRLEAEIWLARAKRK